MNKKFEYTYMAPTEEERKEIEYIQNQYKPQGEKEIKIERLKKLDNIVKNVPSTISLILGIVGLLIFGLGFTMVLEWKIYIWGVIISLLSFFPIFSAYIVYLKLHSKLKKKYTYEILKISNELLENNNGDRTSKEN